MGKLTWISHLRTIGLVRQYEIHFDFLAKFQELASILANSRRSQSIVSPSGQIQPVVGWPPSGEESVSHIASNTVEFDDVDGLSTTTGRSL